MQDNLNKSKYLSEKQKKKNQLFFTMVLDVVVLQMLLTNHGHHLSNVWDCVMKEPMKTSMNDRSVIDYLPSVHQMVVLNPNFQNSSNK